MIYGTYLSKLKEIPSNAVKIFIARQARPEIQESLKKYDCIWADIFGPSNELRDDFKNKKIVWPRFVEDYIVEQSQLISHFTPKRVSMINVIKCAIDEGKDVYVICYEKDPLECHRTPFGHFIAVMFKTEYKEADFSENKNCS